MAIATSPNDTNTVFLSEDEEAPDESKTPIVTKALSGAEFDKHSRSWKPLSDGGFDPLDPDQMDTIVWKPLSQIVRNWSNLNDGEGGAYEPVIVKGFASPPSLKEAFSLGQGIDLCMQIVKANMLTPDQKKASKSQPDSPPAN